MNYLKNIGAYKLKVNKIINKEATQKTKPAYYIEFITDDSRIVSTRLNKPFGEFDWGKLVSFFRVFRPTAQKEGLQKVGEAVVIRELQKLIGQELIGLISARDHLKNTSFQVQSYMPISMAQYLEGGPTNDPFTNDDPFASPVDSALDAFEGATQKDEDIPF